MKLKEVKLCVLSLIGLGLSGLNAQTSIDATGGNANGSGGSVSYSVGQAVYTNSSGTNGSVSQGVQQPYEITEITAIEEAKGVNLSVTAYPNPASTHLTLNLEKTDFSGLSYQLCDLSGKILQNEKVVSNLTSISLQNLVSSTYFLKVIQGNKELITYKIIKN